MRAWFLFFWVLLVMLFVLGPPVLAPVQVANAPAKAVKIAQPPIHAMPPAPAPAVFQIGAGTAYETPYFVFRGAQNGPSVLVEAGIHGDEQAGSFALDEIVRALEVGAGTVVIIPRMNRPAVEHNTRLINVDLNRAFAEPSRREPYEFALAREIMAVAAQQKVQYVVTLHESQRLYQPSEGSGLGQAICYGVEPAPAVLKDWIVRLNAQIDVPRERFQPRYFPIPTSSTEAMVATLHLRGGFCVETWRGLAMARRVVLQRAAVKNFLTTVGVRYRTALHH